MYPTLYSPYTAETFMPTSESLLKYRSYESKKKFCKVCLSNETFLFIGYRHAGTFPDSQEQPSIFATATQQYCCICYRLWRGSERFDATHCNHPDSGCKCKLSIHEAHGKIIYDTNHVVRQILNTCMMHIFAPHFAVAFRLECLPTDPLNPHQQYAFGIKSPRFPLYARIYIFENPFQLLYIYWCTVQKNVFSVDLHHTRDQPLRLLWECHAQFRLLVKPRLQTCESNGEESGLSL